MNKKVTFVEALLTGIGLLIGSGIYFRADNILSATRGNLAMAVLGWLVLGIFLIFCGIGFSVLAARSKGEGGLVAYMEETWGKKAGFATGWFTTMVYIPTLIGVLGIVASGYLHSLLGNNNPSAFDVQALAALLIVITFIWNALSTKFAALFSSAATVIKLIPIILIGFIGLSQIGSANYNEFVAVGKEAAPTGWSLALFTAPMLSMAFAFDGWTTASALSRDMENPQRDIGRVFILVFIVVTAAYVFYFNGISAIGMSQGVDIIKEGDNHVTIIAANLFGELGGKLLTFCIVMSVMGTLNGNVMGAYRYPHALAMNKELPGSDWFKVTTKNNVTLRAGIWGMFSTIAWFIMYTLQALSKEASIAEGKDTWFMSGISFDDIPIVSICILIIILLIAVIKWGSKEGYGTFKSLVSPIIGSIGMLFVVYSFFTNNELALPYLIVVVVIIAIGLLIKKVTCDK